jgi:hypothetical protein
MTKKIPAKNIINALIRLHGQTYAEEMGIKLDGHTSSDLFRLLYSSLLFSTRINAHVALQASRGLGRHGWTTPRKMASSTWDQRVKALDEAHYVRYDEQTATRLGEMARTVVERYNNDLENLRKHAGYAPDREYRLLKEFKGIGDVGAAIFFREAQEVWNELYPFMDERAQRAAARLGLGKDARQLARLTGKKGFPRLVAALARTDLEKDYQRVMQEAKNRT